MILLLLIPAIVVPAVLLIAFAGCGEPAGIFNPPPGADIPVIESAVAESLSAIVLAWQVWDLIPPRTFEVERTRPDGTVDPTVPVAASPFEDTGLPTSKADPITGAVEIYRYRVRSVRLSDGETSDWSTPVSSPTFLISFGGENSLAAGASTPLGGGFCLIQRIETSQLTFSGTKVQMVLRGASAGSLSFDRIYISQPGGAKPYDAGSDLTPVSTTPLVIAPDQILALPVINYALDHNQPLLIAFDLTPATAPELRFLDLPPPLPVEPPSVTTYVSPAAAAEAASPTRSANYSSVPNRLCCIEVIGVGG